MPFKKYSRKKCRGTTHHEDPYVSRTCPTCMRVHRKRLSKTANGGYFDCSCGMRCQPSNIPMWFRP